MDVISTDHISRLRSQQGDVYFDELIAFVSPYRLKFESILSEWKSNNGIYHGRTLVLQNLIKELTDEKVPTWSGKIQALYHKNTHQYQAIFFKGLTVFTLSTYESRINEVKTLNLTLAKYPELADVKSDVEHYYNVLIKTRDEQQKYEGLVKTSRTSLKEVHKTLADAMYRNLAMLMAKFYKKPASIIDFFELEHIQNKKQNKEQKDEEEFAPLNTDGTVMEM
jgi:hypothetical protein